MQCCMLHWPLLAAAAAPSSFCVPQLSILRIVLHFLSARLITQLAKHVLGDNGACRALARSTEQLVLGTHAACAVALTAAFLRAPVEDVPRAAAARFVAAGRHTHTVTAYFFCTATLGFRRLLSHPLPCSLCRLYYAASASAICFVLVYPVANTAAVIVTVAAFSSSSSKRVAAGSSYQQPMCSTWWRSRW